MNLEEKNEERQDQDETKEEKEINNQKQNIEENIEEKDQQIELLQEKLKEKEKEADEYLSYLQRLKADFENYKKRVAKEREEIGVLAKEVIITNFLPVVDNFERAIRASEDSQDFRSLKDGVHLIYKQIKDFLERAGVKEIKSVGEMFNPELHEAVTYEENREVKENVILEEFLKGYRLNKRVIRPAKVKVAKAPAIEEDLKEREEE